MSKVITRLLLCALPILVSSLSCGPTLPPDDGAGQPTPVILPTLLRAVALNNTGVLLTFSDEMEDAAIALGFYRVTGPNSLQITAATLSADHFSVSLTTSPQEDKTYTIEVGELRSRDGRTLDPAADSAAFIGIAKEDVAPPKLAKVASLDNTTVLVSFTEPLGPSAQQISNYAITADADGEPLVVSHAKLNDSLTDVMLTTLSQKPAGYTLIVSGVKDASGNTIDPTANSGKFTGKAAPDNTLPRVVGAISTGNTSVLVTFSEAMADNAINPANYLVGNANVVPEAGGVNVVDAEFLNGDRTAVELTTLSQSTIEYAIYVVNVTDLAGNPLAPKQIGLGFVVDPTSAQFWGTGPSVAGGGSGSAGGLPDTDKDGLTDDLEQKGWIVTIVLADGSVEQRQVTSDPTIKDTDNDGLDDKQEHRRGTDPRNADTDGDLIPDADEINLFLSSPTHQDTDGDGLNDSSELHTFKTSFIREDTDGDGFTDRQEIIDFGRNPRIADLPRPRIDIGDMSLRLDTRFSYTDTQGTSQSKTESSSTTLTESQEQKFAFSDAQTFTHTTNVAAEVANENQYGVTGAAAGWSGKVSFKLSAGYSYTDSNVTTVSQESTKSAQEAYEKSLSTSATVDETQSVTREVAGANMQVALTIGNIGDIAFSMTNLEVTALQQDPLDKTRFLPVATLIPATTLSTGVIPKYTTGPFIPERGPFIFESREIFPSLVEDLLKNPRGLVFKVANFDVEDEFDRNFAFTSQKVNDRTAGLTIDYGNGKVDRYRVAINACLDDETGKLLGGFDSRGLSKGLPMRYVLRQILNMRKNQAPNAIVAGPDGCAQSWASGDDVQVTIPICPAVTPGGVIIQAGPNQILESQPRGDDIRVGDVVRDGGDGCASSIASGDDVTVVQGACASPGDDGVVILAGPNGVINSTPRGDDEVVTITGYATTILSRCDGNTMDAIIEPSSAAVTGLAETTAAGDDEQVIAVGQPADPGAIIIRAGLNGVLETTPTGNDLRVGPGRVCPSQAGCPGGGQCRSIENLIRVKGVQNKPSESRFWILITDADIDLGANFDDIMLEAGETYTLAYVQDKDKDGLLAHEEYLYGSSDTRINTDGCPDPADPYGFGFMCNDPTCADFDTDCLTDFEEVKVGWPVEVEGRSSYRAYSNPARPDSDSDGLLDGDELVYGTDPTKRDTDDDDITDYEEVRGYTIYGKDRTTVVRHVDPYQTLVIVDGGNGTVDTPLAGDDLLAHDGTCDANSATAGAACAANKDCRDGTHPDGLCLPNALPANPDVIISPGANNILESIPAGDDKLATTKVIIDGGNGVVETPPIGDDVYAGNAGDLLVTVNFVSFNIGGVDCDATDTFVGTCDNDSKNSGELCTSETICTDQDGTCKTQGSCDANSVTPDLVCTTDADCRDASHTTGLCLHRCDTDSVNSGDICTTSADCTGLAGDCDLPPGKCKAGTDKPNDDCQTDNDCTSGTTATKPGDCVKKPNGVYVGEYTLTFKVVRTLSDGTTTETVLDEAHPLIAINADDGTVPIDVSADLQLKTGEQFTLTATITEVDSDPSLGFADSAFEQSLPGNETPGTWTIARTVKFSDLTTNQSNDYNVLGTSFCPDPTKTPPAPNACCYGDDLFVYNVTAGGTVRRGGLVILPGKNGRLETTPSPLHGDDLIPAPHAKLFATDPLNRDTDGDTLPDGLERKLGANPNDFYDVGRFRDTDNDGLTDGEERDGWFIGYKENGVVFCINGDGNPLVVNNPASPPAACVVVTSDPTEPDTDRDGLPDALEKAIHSNPRNRDTDGDSLFDYDEFDSESIFSIAFADWRDFKQVCETGVRCSYDPTDSKKYGTSLVRTDTDSDGISDAQELFDGWVVSPCKPSVAPYLVFSDPKTPDKDYDGWDDGTEKLNGSDPNKADTDEDGQIDSVDPVPVVCGKLIRVTFVSWDIGGDDCDGLGKGAGDFEYTLRVTRNGAESIGYWTASDVQINEGSTKSLGFVTGQFALNQGQYFTISGTMKEDDISSLDEPPPWTFSQSFTYSNVASSAGPGQFQTGPDCFSDDHLHYNIEVIGN